MAALTCRCGEPLDALAGNAERIVCPKCSAKVRIIRRKAPVPPPVPDSDGFLRFFCPCGRRLKIDASSGPTHGRCPDCGRVIATAEARTTNPSDDAETPTEEFNAADLARIEAWSRRHLGPAAPITPPMSDDKPPSTAEISPQAAARRGEAGLRVCPQCGKPVHLGTSSCRSCGIAVPKR
ncbi:hypothetical protein TA3x_000067 [Tundrisphaera sp. TA3]|uniref:hypothetical protein n=1 Tax=Tundrisphaera sp. TA3 TaxID=3435775 RepID=UPI003EBFA69D